MGEARPLRAPQPWETARGRPPCPRARAPLLCGEVRAPAVPGIPTRPLGAPGCALSGRGQGAAPPRLPLRRAPSSWGWRARAGRAARAADSPPGPCASPRSPACAPPRARRPGRSPPARPRAAPPACPRREGAPCCGDPGALCFAPWGPRAGGGRQARAPARPAPAALAPRRPPERARRLRSEALAAMIAGSGARAHARPGLGDSGPTDGPWPDRSPVCAADGGRGRRARPCRGQCAPRSSRLGAGTISGSSAAAGFPPG